jgi:hypothetical protein
VAELPPLIPAVQNRKNQKLFIIVDDSLGTRYKVINPAGEVIVLPDLLFEEDPIEVPNGEFADHFTPEQRTSLERFLDEQAARAALEASRPKAPPRAPEPERVPAARPRREGKLTARHQPSRTGLGASWSSPRLTFYKHKIEPLQMKQSFKIVIDGTGEFVITKEEFLAQFNDVVMSPSYRSEGHYTYSKFPEKAQRYLKS